MSESGNFSDGVDMKISAAANVAFKVVGGTMDTLAMSGRVVPLGARGIGWAVSVDVNSFKVKRMLSRRIELRNRQDNVWTYHE